MRSTTIKIDRWLDNNGKRNGIENGTQWQRKLKKDSEDTCARSIKIDQVKIVQKYNSRIATMPADKVENQTIAEDANSSNEASSLDLPSKKIRFNDNQSSKIKPSLGNSSSSTPFQAQYEKLPQLEGENW